MALKNQGASRKVSKWGGHPEEREKFNEKREASSLLG